MTFAQSSPHPFFLAVGAAVGSLVGDVLGMAVGSSVLGMYCVNARADGAAASARAIKSFIM